MTAVWDGRSVLPHEYRLIALPHDARALAMHLVVECMLFAPDDTSLFSYTENEVEVSLIVEDRLAERLRALHPTVVVSADTFRCLQIDNELDVVNGKRISDLTGPIAKAGISIFYLSTYQTDLILVRNKSLDRVLAILDAITSSNPPSPKPVHANGTSTDACLPTAMETLLQLSPSADDATARLLSNFQAACHTRIAPTSVCMVGLNRAYLPANIAVLLRHLFYDDSPGRFVSYTSAAEGVSLVAAPHVLADLPGYMVNTSLVPIPMRVVTVDLTQFGLDRYGLVYSMSHPLTSQGVHLLYLSTVHSANLLVDHGAGHDDGVHHCVRVMLDRLEDRLRDVLGLSSSNGSGDPPNGIVSATTDGIVKAMDSPMTARKSTPAVSAE
ncbi:GATS protein-like 3 [Allomyces javanicus]|nr:GATS protein-like 3 [Allomyces javanicus]